MDPEDILAIVTYLGVSAASLLLIAGCALYFVVCIHYRGLHSTTTVEINGNIYGSTDAPPLDVTHRSN